MNYYSFLDSIEQKEIEKMMDEIDSEEAFYTIQDALKNLNNTRLLEQKELIEKQIEKKEDLPLLAQKYWRYKIKDANTQDTLRALKYRSSHLSVNLTEQIKQIKEWEKKDIIQDDFFTKEEREIQLKTLQAFIYEKGFYSFLIQRREERNQKKLQVLEEYSQLIDMLPFLSNIEKKHSISLLNMVETKAKMKEIVQEAKEKNYFYEERQFYKKKELLIQKVQTLSLENKEDWICRIEKAKYNAELDNIIEQL